MSFENEFASNIQQSTIFRVQNHHEIGDTFETKNRQRGEGPDAIFDTDLENAHREHPHRMAI